MISVISTAIYPFFAELTISTSGLYKNLNLNLKRQTEREIKIKFLQAVFSSSLLNSPSLSLTSLLLFTTFTVIYGAGNSSISNLESN